MEELSLASTNTQYLNQNNLIQKITKLSNLALPQVIIHDF